MTTLYYDPGKPAPNRFKVMLATPVYDSPDAAYTFSLQSARAYLADEHDIGTAYLLLAGNCHVDDSRNSLVKEFLASDCNALFFIDGDVTWQNEDLFAVLSSLKDHHTIYGGVYPYRRPALQWPQSMPVRTMPGAEIGEGGLIEVEGLPTGFMCIPRPLFERMAADAEKFHPKRGQDVIPLLFERSILGGQRMGGDIGFCVAAREKYGAKCFALANLRLGHVGKSTITGSLATSLRAQNGDLLKYVMDRVREGSNTLDDLQDAFDHVGNRWGCPVDVLAYLVKAARHAKAPIVETGTGLSTLLMAAATDQTVYAFEHSKEFALRLERLAFEAGGGFHNLAVVEAPMVNRWYDPRDLKDLPEKFAFGFIDGPPRHLGDRSVFFDSLADRCGAVICDDAAGFSGAMEAYAAKRGWQTLVHGERVMWIGKDATQ
jgi:predicted O-methyltransferase YrrM